ncbi:hypothetical protein CR513_33114, partial [Mucuna pruriens]
MEGRDQVGAEGMHCIDHPHRNNPTSTGICAFCLQEKLGKLVSSSFPSPPSSLPPPLSSLSDHPTRSRLPFHLPNTTSSTNSSSDNIHFKRSKSTATPRRNHGFWSFLYPSSKPKGFGPTGKPKCPGSSKKTDRVIAEEEKCVGSSSSSSKVSRSRSVGCGSRSFSGDFFERISSGLGDCTLRRVESQREGKPCIKERVRCGGIFAGFAVTSSSSSSSSSWDDAKGRTWGWAFASPIRALATKPSSKRLTDASPNNATPNLSAIPSLLTVRA